MSFAVSSNAEKDHEDLLKKRRYVTEQMELLKKELQNLANDLILKARLTEIDYSLDINKRNKLTKEYFERALEAHRSPENLRFYGEYLKRINEINAGTQLLNEAYQLEK